MIPTTNMIRNLFYASGSKSVDTVIVDGKVVLDGGVFTGLDERALLQAIDEASRALLSRMGRYPSEPNRIPRPFRPI